MRTSVKNAITLALAATVTVSAATPTLARDWRPWAAAGAGFVAGAAIANSANRVYYGPGGYYGYAYAPAYESYAYVPPVTYEAPAYYAPRYYYGSGCTNFGDSTRSNHDAAC